MSLVKPGSGIAFSGEPWSGSVDQAKNESFFTGSTQTDNHPVDPLVTGFAFWKWTKIPSWVEQEYKNFRALSEKNLRAFTGMDDLELATIGVQAGFTPNETMAAAGITKPQGFSMTHKEWSGSPMRNVYTHWVSGIRDPETGVATYPKAYGIEYGARNHTGEGIYIMTRPDADNVENGHIIEYAQYFTNVMPTKLPLGHLNYTAGTQENPEIEMTFTGNRHTGAKVDEFAQKIIKETYKFRHENEFTSSSFGG